MALRLTKNALEILERRYLRKGDDGSPIEQPEDLLRRVSHTIALAEVKYAYPKEIAKLQKKYKKRYWEITETDEFKALAKKSSAVKKTAHEFYTMLSSLDFLPNSPTLLNAGRKLQQLSACYVLPIGDSIDSIFKTLYHAALIHKTGAGTGFNFSRLRPRGDLIEDAGYTTGPVSFMKVYDAATNEVKLGGVLRGANMGILEAWHPDIKEFISIKSKEKTLTNFNISVGLRDEVMKAYRHHSTYELKNPRSDEAVGKESARELLMHMSEEAWATGDPGVVFLDRMNAFNPTPALGSLECTDSCGEQPLLPYESCILGSVNLKQMVTHGAVDFAALKKVVWRAVHFLDNAIDMCNYPLEETHRIVEQTRKIGLGVMGFADMLILLDIPYNSQEGLMMAERVMGFIKKEADAASEKLAETRGCFPAWEKSVYHRHSKWFKGTHRKLRNATRTTIAPTGTISIIAGCSSGIEPLFAVSYARKTAEGKILYYFNDHLKRSLEKKGMYTDEIRKKISENGSLQHVGEISHDIKRLFVVAQDISPEYHVEMQAMFQKHVDNGISKTVTLPYTSTPKDIETIYHLAYELGCKGISVYRSGSRVGQVMYLSSQRDEQITLADWVE